MSSLYLFLYNRLKASETTRGLVAGATGTGKTITMQVLAESFSNAGVPVFVTDIKGDVSGMALEGQDKGWQKKRAERIELESFEFQASPVMFWGFFGEFGHPVRATVSEVGPFLLSRMLDLTEAQEGVINIAFKLSDEEGLPLLNLKDLRAMLGFLGGAPGRDFQAVWQRFNGQHWCYSAQVARARESRRHVVCCGASARIR